MCHFYTPSHLEISWWSLSYLACKWCFLHLWVLGTLGQSEPDLAWKSTRATEICGGIFLNRDTSGSQGRTRERGWPWSAPSYWVRQWGSCGGRRRQAEKGAVIAGKPSSNASERIGYLGPRLIHQTERGDAGKESEKRTQDFTSAVQNLNNEAVGLVTVKWVAGMGRWNKYTYTTNKIALLFQMT